MDEREPGAGREPEAEPSPPGEGGRPRYFNLLSDAELASLKPVLEILREDREVVLARWLSSYIEHFGETRALTRDVFLELFGRDLEALVENLVTGDRAGFEADERALGRELVERGVPFAEIVASLHLFEESSVERLRDRPEVQTSGPSIYLTFDKLSHVRIILLASAYFSEHTLQADLRTRGLELEAKRLGVVAAEASRVPVARARFHGLVGRSEAMQRLYARIAAASEGTGATLIVGESGTGKEVVARAVHEAKGLASRPFVAVNCAALPRDLVESELFGHRKGAYSGAEVEYAGLVRSAQGGTLFLDEVTEMAVEAQAKLLRVLEERTIRAVGTARELPVDVRFVASTNRDPEKAVAAGLLREDLYYRLHVHRLDVPPLRERLEDIAELALYFADLFRGRGLRPIDSIAPDALEVLSGHSWPGNVRELKNAIEQALTIGKSDRLARADLPLHLVRLARPGGVGAPRTDAAPVPSLQAAEKDLIARALAAASGNKVKTAKMLRISRHQLYDKLRRYGLG